MNNNVDKFVTGMGALAEALGVFRDGLIKNGFTREEALGLCAEFMAMIHPHGDYED